MDYKLELVLIPRRRVPREEVLPRGHRAFALIADTAIGAGKSGGPVSRRARSARSGSALASPRPRPGSGAQGLHLVVSDILARAGELVERRVAIGPCCTYGPGAGGTGLTRSEELPVVRRRHRPGR